nr:MAG TPA: hypothetical protein [Crassvirales sp.]
MLTTSILYVLTAVMVIRYTSSVRRVLCSVTRCLAVFCTVMQMTLSMQTTA